MESKQGKNKMVKHYTKEEWKQYRKERKRARAHKQHEQYMADNPDYANQVFRDRREKASWDSITALIEDYRELMAKYIDAKQQIEKLQTERDALVTVIGLTNE